jgi:hypothetical protein
MLWSHQAKDRGTPLKLFKADKRMSNIASFGLYVVYVIMSELRSNDERFHCSVKNLSLK